ncbi:MAG: tRNA lysidine(34) synthetase TilS [Allosphingosinicella sp.]|uniref:tRNA lysidine(34) synthetase TilS n=1 Tax=Allosphingosinicella sp. TaxID=2823234 RepID=UPI00394D540A
MAVAPDTLARFRGDLAVLAGGEPERIGIALSGGPDSLALLLLAAAAWPGRVEAATVDHKLRTESAAEAGAAAACCAAIGVAHAVLAPDWPEAPAANVQAEARAARYAALGRWARERGLALVATAHHADDQAETLLMRLARGAGIGGLAGVRARRALADGVVLVRPLLGWRKAELVEIVRAAGLTPADDPSNRDARYDRTRARALLAEANWPAPERLAAAAAHLAEAEEALAWTAERLWEERVREDGDGLRLATEGLPRELKRRLLAAALARLGAEAPPGPKLIRLIEALEQGETGTLAGVLARPAGTDWLLTPAPPRTPR